MALAVVALGGCAAAGPAKPHVPRPLNLGERIEMACGDLRSTLAGIAVHTAELREPSAGSPVGRQVPRRLEAAVKEAVAALYRSAEEFEAMPAPYELQLAVSDAIEAYDRFSQTLPRSDPRTATEGLHLWLRYAAIEDRVDRICASDS